MKPVAEGHKNRISDCHDAEREGGGGEERGADGLFREIADLILILHGTGAAARRPA